MNIQTGRYYSIAPDQRFWPFRRKHIDDEFHFIMECSRYASLPNELSIFLESSTTDFKRLDATNRFVYILSCQNGHDAKIDKYINDCSAEIRNNETNDWRSVILYQRIMLALIVITYD